MIEIERETGENRNIWRQNGSKLFFFTWIDPSQSVSHPPGSGAASYDGSVVTMKTSDWSALITHLPAVSGRKKVAAAPTMEHRPRMRRGRMEE